MKQALAGLVGSKKFITFVTTAIVAFAARKGLDIDPELVAAFIGLGGILIFGQGLADQGKEAAKVRAASDQAPAQVNVTNVGTNDTGAA
jgi:hypothetical protein